MLCIWWDQKGLVYYELRKPGDSIAGDRLQLIRLSRALREKRPEYKQRHDKVILLHDNARPHVVKVIKNIWKRSNEMFYRTCRILRTLLLLITVVPKDAASHRFTSFAEIENWLQNWIASKDESFFSNSKIA